MCDSDIQSEINGLSEMTTLRAGVILETDGSVRKIQERHFFTTKMLKRAPLI